MQHCLRLELVRVVAEVVENNPSPQQQIYKSSGGRLTVERILLFTDQAETASTEFGEEKKTMDCFRNQEVAVRDASAEVVRFDPGCGSEATA